jgi:Sec-independent protein translocase protein TatA
MQRVAIILLFVIVVLAALFGITYLPEMRDPEVSAMREYRLSGLTDERLRELHQQAVVEAEKQRVADVNATKEARAKLSAEFGKCISNMSDPAFRARHPGGCNGIPLLLLPDDDQPLYGRKSSEELFEDMIIGPCYLARSVRQARMWGCLPPRQFP